MDTVELVNAYWIKTFFTLIIFIVFVILFVKNSATKPNISPRELVTKELRHLDSSYSIFDSIFINSDRGVIQIAYVVVSPYGIFVITICDLRGKISGYRNDREWELRSRGAKDMIANPLWENRKEINALEKRLGQQPFVPAVVFTHAKLISDFGPSAIRVGQLQGFILSHKRKLINEGDLTKITSILTEELK